MNPTQTPKKAAPKKAASKTVASRPGARIVKLEAENEQLRVDLDQVRWCFMELVYHLGVAQKVAQLQQIKQAEQLLMADPDVQQMMRAQQGVPSAV